MPSWLLALLTPFVERLAERIGRSLIRKIQSQIKYSKAVKEYENITDPQARAAYIKSHLTK